MEFLSFMTKVNQSNGNETESNIFPWDIFKPGNISFFIKIYFSDSTKSEFLRFMTKVNSNNANETKSDISPWDIFKSDFLFHWS